VSGSPYAWDDTKLMAANVSSGFNLRAIAGSPTPSLHTYGCAFDINPVQNPYTRYTEGETIISPPGTIWNPEAPGRLTHTIRWLSFLESETGNGVAIGQ
jgi:hypothetical protein